MKKVNLFIAALLPLSAVAQGGYTVAGKVSGLNVPAKAYLTLVQDDAFKDKDSVEITNGTFQFKGKVSEPQQAIISLKKEGLSAPDAGNDYVPFLLENSKIYITGQGTVRGALVSGSKSEQERKSLEALVNPLTDKIIKLNNELREQPKNEALKIASDSITHLVAAIKRIKLDFIQTHLNSYIGMYTYYTSVLSDKIDPAEALTLFKRFSPAMQSSALGRRAYEKIETAKRGQIGMKATNFTQNDINGKPFSLSSLKGKYVLVDFWASWCGPCRAENPNVRKAYEQLKSKNFEIVSVSLDSGKSPWIGAIEKDGMPWTNVCDFKGWKNDVALLYGINSVPQNFLIDPNGIIVARDLRGEDLTKKLAALMQ